MESSVNEYREELRDRFAMAALAALLSHIPPSAAFAAPSGKQTEDEVHEKLASEAYRWAEAMLKVRNQA